MRSEVIAGNRTQQPLHHAFIRTAKHAGGKTAFIDRNTGRRLSYKESLIAALLLARYLKRFPDDYIGVMLPNSVACTLAILGTLLAGKVPVMLNYSTGAEQNCRYAMEKCGFRTILSTASLLRRIDCPQLAGMVLIEEVLAGISAWEKTTAALRALLPAKLLQLINPGRLDDTAVIMFTSGSEKAPKGVELSHRNIYSDILAIYHAVDDLHDGDIMLSVLPLFHVYGFTVTFWLPMVAGMCVVLHGNPLEFKTVVQIIREEKPSLMVATPYFLSGYLRQAQRGDFASLRLVIAGADKCPEKLYKEYLQTHAIEILEGYGATETSPVVSVNLVGANKPGSLGKPLPGVQVRIVALDTGRELPRGGEGKIQVKGETVMKGYFQDLEQTALHIEDGWYETGDMGLLDSDGFLWHRGRLKRFIKVGGEMVSLVQIESEVEKLLPPACDCCVVEVPDGKKGSQIVVALSQETDTKQLRDALKSRLPPVALPRRFCVLPELPKMGSGKIDFRATTELVRSMDAGSA